MATTSPDEIWTPDSGDDYALTTDLAAMADTVQDAITNRVTGVQSAMAPRYNRYARSVTSDSSVSSGTYIGLIEGTITDAPAGMYYLDGRASLYAAAGNNVVGRVYVEWGPSGSPTREEARWDIPNLGSYPMSATVSRVITHPGGNLRIATGYRRDSGTFNVTAANSGLTVIAATYLGPTA